MRAALIAFLAQGTEATSTEHGGFWADAYPIIPHPGELIFGFVTFAVLYVIVARKVVPRLETMLAERTAAIEGGIANADRLQAEAAATLERYRAQLAAVQDDAARIREEAREEGARILADLREQAQREAARILEAAQGQIQAERQQAVVSLRAETGRMAVDLASRIVGEALEDEVRQRRTVDRFLEELEASATAAVPGGQR